ncbi:hypothetical protein KKI24_16395 [bacterium]|nr:hypothetical protein [bacterium]
MNYFETLKTTVQRNCDRVDAENAQSFGLCIYLLRMWDYYRWWHSLALSAHVANEKILPWIGDVEEYWESIEGESFSDLLLEGQSFDPFRTREINEILNPKQLVYSGGLSYGGIPMFFLAKLDKIELVEGFKVVISTDEIARGLYGFPAMLQEKTIFIRKEALRNMVWSRYEEWQFKKRDNSMGRAFTFYDFSANPEQALNQMVENELKTLILHEVGEGKLKAALGEEWGEMLIDFAYSKTEIVARAVKDLAADCLMTLPSLLETNQQSSIHFYFANFSDMRKTLFPELLEAYHNWVQGADMSGLTQLIDKGRTKWQKTGEDILDLYREKGQAAGESINKLVA